MTMGFLRACMKNLFSIVVTLLAVLLPGLAAAQDMAPEGPLATDALTESFANPAAEFLRQVATLVEAGQYEQAHRLLILPRMQPRPHLEVLFLSGLIYARQGAYHSAADEFRSMLARDATLIRPRLELAHALFISKDYEGASYHFQQVLAGNLPDEARAKVLAFLSAIREQLPSFSFSLDIVNDSNPKQSTNNKTVTIGGRTYRLNTTAPDQTIRGVVLSGSAHIPLPGDPSWFTRANASLTDYPNTDNDQLYLQATVGKHIGFNEKTLTLEAGHQFFEYRGRNLYSGAVWRASEFWRQNDRLNWQAVLQGGQQTYPDYPYLNGWQHTLSLENQFVQSANSRWQTGASYSRNQVRELAYSFSNPGCYFRYVHEWQGGFISGIRWQKSLSSYFGDDPFFGMRRHDSEQRIEVDLVNRNWQIGKLSPRLLLGGVHHVSNISLYEFRRNFVKIGVSREF